MDGGSREDGMEEDARQANPQRTTPSPESVSQLEKQTHKKPNVFSWDKKVNIIQCGAGPERGK